MICKLAAGKKATAKMVIGGGFFGSATAGMKISSGFRDESQVMNSNSYLRRTGSTKNL